MKLNHNMPAPAGGATAAAPEGGVLARLVGTYPHLLVQDTCFSSCISRPHNIGFPSPSGARKERTSLQTVSNWRSCRRAINKMKLLMTCTYRVQPVVVSGPFATPSPRVFTSRGSTVNLQILPLQRGLGFFTPPPGSLTLVLVMEGHEG
jgi:hypothetical protein